MNKYGSGILKIITITFVVFLICTVIYTIMIKDKTGTQNYKIPSVIIGIIVFFILGLLAGNHHQKKGLLVGFIYGFILIGILVISLIIADNKIEPLLFLKYAIFVISTIVGGILGVNIKKFI